MDDPAFTEPQRTTAVLAYVEHASGARCPHCTVTLCGHEAVMNLVIGFKDAPRCLSCLAIALDRNPRELRDHLLAYIHHHDCYRAGWRRASERETFDPAASPACLWGKGEEAAMVVSDGVGRFQSEASNAPDPDADAEWDAGDMGCGDLVLELRNRLRSMSPGTVLKITALDPGAPEDLPAWCGLTGHRLVHSRHPEYWIRRKEG